jgi:hypothetical protein
VLRTDFAKYPPAHALPPRDDEDDNNDDDGGDDTPPYPPADSPEIWKTCYDHGYQAGQKGLYPTPKSAMFQLLKGPLPRCAPGRDTPLPPQRTASGSARRQHVGPGVPPAHTRTDPSIRPIRPGQSDPPARQRPAEARSPAASCTGPAG